jgi:hypothetical protein
MNYSGYLHWFGLIGFALVLVLQVYEFSDAKEKKKTKLTWTKFMKRNLNDWIVMIIFGQALVFLQEFIANGIAAWFYSNDESFWDKYYDSEEILAVCLGLFGLWIIRRFFKIGVSKIEASE